MSDASSRKWRIIMVIDGDVRAVLEISREGSETEMVFEREEIVGSGRRCLILG